MRLLGPSGRAATRGAPRAPSSAAAAATGLYIDREYPTVLSAVGSNSTVRNVKRGVAGIQTSHAARP
jgi:hypothetical protein